MDVDQEALKTEIENELAQWLIEKNDRPMESKGWYTAGKMAELSHMSYDRANNLLNKGIEKGEVELKLFGKIRYYRRKKG